VRTADTLNEAAIKDRVEIKFEEIVNAVKDLKPGVSAEGVNSTFDENEINYIKQEGARIREELLAPVTKESILQNKSSPSTPYKYSFMPTSDFLNLKNSILLILKIDAICKLSTLFLNNLEIILFFGVNTLVLLSVLFRLLVLIYSQYSKICGTYHGFMPSIVKSLSIGDYLTWLNSSSMSIFFISFYNNNLNLLKNQIKKIKSFYH
jgi:hypothetical protein